VKILLGTHALLWWMVDDARLGPQARGLVADPGNDVLVSTASLWEIVVKMRAGKLEADIKELCDAIDQQGFIPLGIETAHLLTLAGLPTRHRDPFDHLLIAQAITEGATLISKDRNTLKYPVQAVTCSD
jgi:PIN domain nuclease of toxin-antitoxin system